MELQQLEAAAYLLARAILQPPKQTWEALHTRPAFLDPMSSLASLSPWDGEGLLKLSALFPWEGASGALEQGIFGTSVGLNPQGELCVRVYANSRGREYLDTRVLRGLMIPPMSPHNQEVPIWIVSVESIQFAAMSRQRPCMGGDSVGALNGSETGTLGAWLKKNPSGVLVGLSNNHVVADLNHFGLWHDVLQPGPVDGGGAGDEVGQIEGVEHLKEHDPFRFNETLNLADVAWVCPTTPISAVAAAGIGATQLLPVGEVDLIQQYRGQQPLPVSIWLSGRTSGTVKGTITGIRTSVMIQERGKKYYFEDQLELTFSKLNKGDSGALVLTEPGNELGGLFFALDSNLSGIGFANPWQAVTHTTGLTFLYP